MYTLVMAAFMLIGGKFGERWGAKRAFWIGLIVYGTGSFLTSVAPNLAVLLVGWSVIEGLGAILVIPAIAALTAATYQGKQRAIAYGILGGVSGASMAAGPLIGGWVSAYLSWRYVFAAESVVVLIILGFLKDHPGGASAQDQTRHRRRRPVRPGPRIHRARHPALQPVGLDHPEPRRPPDQRQAADPARAVPDPVADPFRRSSWWCSAVASGRSRTAVTNPYSTSPS